jgi:uncharacterized protein
MGMTSLTREQVVGHLLASEREIRALGVERLAPFGSVVRGEARPDSDVDLLVQFSPGAETYDHFLALSEFLEARLARRIELLNRGTVSVLGAANLGGSAGCPSSRVITFATSWSRQTI